jgi:hypothetical protein
LVAETTSLCPECLERIPAQQIAEDGSVYLAKECAVHGAFKTLIWRGDAKSYREWVAYGQAAVPPYKSLTEHSLGCPYDCGMCSEHQANACTMVIEVTGQCDLGCPVCFADSDGTRSSGPSLEAVEKMYDTVLEAAGNPTIQLSGGEPTLRHELPEIISMGKRKGFSHIMVNSNGIRIARETDYAKRLKDAGAGTVFLQFDGVTDDVYRYTRGRDLYEVKLRVLENCARAGIGVLLVPTVKPGVNDHQLGDIIRIAKAWIPTVRGIHLQPISYLGRFRAPPRDEDRITVPDVIEKLVQQTGGELKADHFLPRRSQHSHCSFSGLFLMKDGRLKAITRRTPGKSGKEWAGYFRAPWESARSFQSLHWQISIEQVEAGTQSPCVQGPYQEVAERGLTITCMPFQDIWNLDLERLKRCCGHVAQPDGRIIPFCSYYLTSATGERLYQGPGSRGRGPGKDKESHQAIKNRQ